MNGWVGDILQIIGILTVVGVGCVLWLIYGPSPKRSERFKTLESRWAVEAIERGHHPDYPPADQRREETQP